MIQEIANVQVSAAHVLPSLRVSANLGQRIELNAQPNVARCGAKEFTKLTFGVRQGCIWHIVNQSDFDAATSVAIPIARLKRLPTLLLCPARRSLASFQRQRHETSPVPLFAEDLFAQNFGIIRPPSRALGQDQPKGHQCARYPRSAESFRASRRLFLALRETIAGAWSTRDGTPTIWRRPY